MARASSCSFSAAEVRGGGRRGCPRESEVVVESTAPWPYLQTAPLVQRGRRGDEVKVGEVVCDEVGVCREL